MKTNCRQLVMSLALLGMVVLPMNAAVVPGQALAVGHIFNSVNGIPVTGITSLNMQLGYVTDIVNFTVGATLFDQFTLTPSDVGKTFSLTAQSDPEFGAFVQRLTNGRNDMIAFADSFGGLSGQNESLFFSQRIAGSNGIDLRGFQIGSIALRVDSLTIASPGSNPNGDGNWTDVFFEGTITVHAVPEPSSGALIGVAGLLLLNQKRCPKR
ncbi:MAG: PEP-CTERM sorting domain-containing protein [Akkermansiaceae bacterium]|nr:PEP-CTERM sorting domain-containing protein [Verrucomicrobiales bacterium]